MTYDHQGASLAGTGPLMNGAQEVSAVPVSVPCAGDWVLHRAGYQGSPINVELAQVEKVTPKLIRFRGSYYPRQCGHLDIVASVPTKDVAERLRDAVRGVDGEFRRRRRAAEDERSRRVTEAIAAANKQVAVLIAQGMSAGTAETQSGSGLQPASPVPEGNAP